MTIQPTQDWKKEYDNHLGFEIDARCNYHNSHLRKEIFDFISQVAQSARDNGYKEGARVQAEMDALTIKQERESAIAKTKEEMKQEWIINFVEYATYKEGYQGGRIEIVPFQGDPIIDKIEIGDFVLPTEDWDRLRKRHEGIRFGNKHDLPSSKELK